MGGRGKSGGASKGGGAAGGVPAGISASPADWGKFVESVKAKAKASGGEFEQDGRHLTIRYNRGVRGMEQSVYQTIPSRLLPAPAPRKPGSPKSFEELADRVTKGVRSAEREIKAALRRQK